MEHVIDVKIPDMMGHKSLLDFIKQVTEKLGYTAKLEQGCKDGRIDLTLEKKITIEVETGENPRFLINLIKCLEMEPNKHIHVIQSQIPLKESTLNGIEECIKEIFKIEGRDILSGGIIVGHISKRTGNSVRHSQRLVHTSGIIEKVSHNKYKLKGGCNDRND